MGVIVAPAHASLIRVGGSLGEPRAPRAADHGSGAPGRRVPPGAPLLLLAVAVIAGALAFYGLLPRIGAAGAAAVIETCDDWTVASGEDRWTIASDLLRARLQEMDGITAAPSEEQVALFLSALDEWCQAPPEEVVQAHGDIALRLTTVADVKYEAHRDALTEGKAEPTPSASPAPSG